MVQFFSYLSPLQFLRLYEFLYLSSSREIHRVVKTAEEKGMKRIGPYSVTKTMANTTSAAISTFFGTKGVSFSIASACSTSLHCISHGFDLIKNGKQDIVIAGGAPPAITMSCFPFLIRSKP